MFNFVSNIKRITYEVGGAFENRVLRRISGPKGTK
jgi:hypothetical protein